MLLRGAYRMVKDFTGNAWSIVFVAAVLRDPRTYQKGKGMDSGGAGAVAI